MDTRVLGGFPVELSLEKTLQGLKLDERRSQKLGVEDIFKTAAALIHPQAIFGEAYVRKRGLGQIEIDGVEFRSRVLAKHLEHIERVFPYVLTIGDSLENKSRSSGNIITKLVLETVGDLALGSGLEHVQRHISDHYRLDTTSHMGPGQLDWPIEQQRELFSLLGHVKDTIGVALTESSMMVPRKSISGIIFPTEETFVTCQLCQRNKCPSRKAAFDRAASEKYDYDPAVNSSRP